VGAVEADGNRQHVNIVEKTETCFGVGKLSKKTIAPTGAVMRAAPGRFVKERETVR
jgi:hypothetical protein